MMNRRQALKAIAAVPLGVVAGVATAREPALYYDFRREALVREAPMTAWLSCARDPSYYRYDFRLPE